MNWKIIVFTLKGDKKILKDIIGNITNIFENSEKEKYFYPLWFFDDTKVIKQYQKMYNVFKNWKTKHFISDYDLFSLTKGNKNFFTCLLEVFNYPDTEKLLEIFKKEYKEKGIILEFEKLNVLLKKRD